MNLYQFIFDCTTAVLHNFMKRQQLYGKHGGKFVVLEWEVIVKWNGLVINVFSQ